MLHFSFFSEDLEYRFGNEDLPCAGALLNALGKIHDVTDGRIVLALGAPEIADYRLAGVQTDAKVQTMDCRQRAVMVSHRGRDRLRCQNSSRNMIILWVQRCVEQGHDAIAEELVDYATVARDSLGGHGEVAVDNGDEPLRIEALAETSETTDVGEENADGLDQGVRGPHSRTDPPF